MIDSNQRFQQMKKHRSSFQAALETATLWSGLHIIHLLFVCKMTCFPVL